MGIRSYKCIDAARKCPWGAPNRSASRIGKWRIHGTGDFKVWFPMDSNRPHRDRVFILAIKNLQVNIGFTVEDRDAVESYLKFKKTFDKELTLIRLLRRYCDLMN
jgi:hypothetical protein